MTQLLYAKGGSVSWNAGLDEKPTIPHMSDLIDMVVLACEPVIKAANQATTAFLLALCQDIKSDPGVTANSWRTHMTFHHKIKIGFRISTVLVLLSCRVFLRANTPLRPHPFYARYIIQLNLYIHWSPVKLLNSLKIFNKGLILPPPLNFYIHWRSSIRV